MKIGEFLLGRLEETRIGHVFGVAGDFNLELLQQLKSTSQLRWTGTCRELNAWLSVSCDRRWLDDRAIGEYSQADLARVEADGVQNGRCIPMRAEEAG